MYVHATYLNKARSHGQGPSPVGVLKPGDEPLHYSDSSHRWICPDPDLDQEVWTERVRAHVEEHRRPDPPGARPATPPAPTRPR